MPLLQLSDLVSVDGLQQNTVYAYSRSIDFQNPNALNACITSQRGSHFPAP